MASKEKVTKSKHQKANFQDHWLVDPILKLCTEKDITNETLARCLYCQKSILAENYLEHVASSFHSLRIPEGHKPIISKISQEEEKLNSTVMKSYLNSEFSKRQLELMILQFVIQNNLAFELGSWLGEFLRSLKPEHIHQMKSISLSAKKMNSIVTQCMKPALEEKNLEVLKENKFSLLLDLATDCSGCSQLCVLARYYEDGEIKQNFLKNVEVKQSITGEKIFKYVEECSIKSSFNMEESCGSLDR